jgi:hypothetical protein
MMRSIVVLSTVLALTAACSNNQPAQTGDTGAVPAASPAPAQPPAASTPAEPAASAGTASTGAPAASPSAASQPSQTTAAKPEASTSAALRSSGAPPAAAAAAPVEPVVHEYEIPASTPLSVRLESPLASDVSKVEDPVRGTLTKAVVVSGRTVAPAGAEVRGSVLDVQRSGRVKGRASIAFQFERLIVNGESYPIRTARIERLAEVKRSEDVKKGGIGAAAGAVIGGLAGGKKGAVIGGAVGGTGAVVATRGEEVRLAAGTPVTTRLTEPVTIQLSGNER